jgi:hypothetical protein
VLQACLSGFHVEHLPLYHNYKVTSFYFQHISNIHTPIGNSGIRTRKFLP